MRAALLVLSVTLAVSASAEIRFPRPNVVPEPVRLDFTSNAVCRLDDAATVTVRGADAAAADWVKAKCREFLHVSPAVGHVSAGRAEPLAEGAYRLRAEGPSFTIDADSASGVRHAFYTLRMCLMAERGVREAKAWICPALDVEDAPRHAFRGLHVCWMPETSVWTVERQIRMAAYLKFNYVLIEFWGTYDSERYPWFGWPDVKVPRSEISRLVRLGRDLGVTLVPDLNAFGHASMARRGGGKHATLDLNPGLQPLFEPCEGWVWCLTNPETQKVLRGLIDEMYGLFERPGYFHIGCDESDEPTCPVCAATDWPVTVGRHIRGLHDHLASLGAKTLMWQDMLISRKDPRWAGLTRRYPINGRSAEACAKLLAELPRDIVICDWYYGAPLDGYPTWDYFAGLGFPVMPTAWNDYAGTLAMGRAAAEKGTWGFLGSFWHHAYNAELYVVFLPTAEAAWGSADRAGKIPGAPLDFATRWRQVGWDMGLDGRLKSGYSENEIPKHTVTPW